VVAKDSDGWGFGPIPNPIGWLCFNGATLFRIFSTFPDGWPGAGLVLLRAASGALLTTQGIAYLSEWSALSLLTSLIALLSLLSGLMLILGCLTLPAAFLAAIACASGIVWPLTPSVSEIFGSRLPCGLVAVIAMSLACLGPGAFSLDALLFGRREVVIPK